MKSLVALTCVVGLCAAGCAFRAGAEQETLSVEYRGDIKYSAEDMSEERAEWGMLEYRIIRTIGEGCESQRLVQDYDTRVPYKLGTECGNFMQGVVSMILLPVTVPLVTLSGTDAKILGEHFKQIGHNLNIFLATPPDDAYLFNTPARRKPIGEPRESGWTPVRETLAMPLQNARVEIRIDALGHSGSGTTDEKGVVAFDVSKVARDVRTHEGEDFAEVAVQLLIKDVLGRDEAPVIKVTSRIYRQVTGE